MKSETQTKPFDSTVVINIIDIRQLGCHHSYIWRQRFHQSSPWPLHLDQLGLLSAKETAYQQPSVWRKDKTTKMFLALSIPIC